MTVQTFSTDLFSWHKASEEFVTEASDLGNEVPFAVNVLDDDPDYHGFNLVSARTGDTETMILVGDVQDDDGDVTMLIFKPRNKDLNFTVKVFND